MGNVRHDIWHFHFFCHFVASKCWIFSSDKMAKLMENVRHDIWHFPFVFWLRLFKILNILKWQSHRTIEQCQTWHLTILICFATLSLQNQATKQQKNQNATFDIWHVTFNGILSMFYYLFCHFYTSKYSIFRNF